MILETKIKIWYTDTHLYYALTEDCLDESLGGEVQKSKFWLEISIDPNGWTGTANSYSSAVELRALLTEDLDPDSWL